VCSRTVCKLQKGCTRLAAASDKVYQLLAHGRWFSPGTPSSSTTKTGRHAIAEILLKVTLNTRIPAINLSDTMFGLDLEKLPIKTPYRTNGNTVF
jgi:hypothetical protein